MDILRAWLAGLITLGAVYLVGTHGQGLSTVLGAGQRFISGTETTVLKG